MADQELADIVSGGPPLDNATIPGPETDAPEPKRSLRDELSKNFKELREPAELRAKAPAKTEKPASNAKTDDDRPRDPAGKFLPKETTEKTVELKAPVELAAKTDVSPAPVSTPPGLPPGWSPETKAFVEALPPDHPLRKDVAKRETEISNGIKKYSDDAKKYTEIEQVLAPVRQTYQMAGIQSDAEAIKRLFMWENMIRQNPAPAIAQLARQYGVDLASFAQSPGSNQTLPDANPQLQLQQAIQPYIAPLQSELQRMQSERAQSEISAFSKDKPYFDKVKTTMGQLMAQGAATDLDKAYQMATWNDPDIRAEMIQKELDGRLSANQQAQANQVQRSQTARKAAVSPSTKAPAAPQVNGKDKPKGVRGSILNAIESIREERA